MFLKMYKKDVISPICACADFSQSLSNRIWTLFNNLYKTSPM